MRARVLTVNVFEHDSALLAGVGADVAADVAARGDADVVAYPRGLVDLRGERGAGFGLLLLDGFLCREVMVAGRTSVELLGSGDMLRPWEDERADAPVPVESAHRALTAVRLAVLDGEFSEAVAAWPEVAEAVCARFVERARWLAVQLALTGARLVEDRLLVLLWHLADRWGRVERDGTIVCPVPITHGLLAGMVSAQRPTVTTALARLAVAGRVAKHPEGWTLLGAPPTLSEFEGKALADAFRLRRED